jgi:hypothetical protein
METERLCREQLETTHSSNSGSCRGGAVNIHNHKVKQATLVKMDWLS